MRISDWSSDVCSSDLEGIVIVRGKPGELAVLSREIDDHRRRKAAVDRKHRPAAIRTQRHRHFGAIEQHEPLDRKSVVWGKRGSVRLDLGGSRIIKKKNLIQGTLNNKTHTTKNN